MLRILIVILLIGLSTFSFAQEPEKVGKVNDGVNLQPIHVSHILNSQEFLDGLVPLEQNKSNSNIVIDNLGDFRNFWVHNLDTEEYESKQFQLVRKGKLSQLWFDTSEMEKGRLNEDVADVMFRYLEERSNSFSFNPEKGIVELSNEVFGDAPNVDGDGIVDFLITDIQDGWTEESENGYVAGFFFSGDQFAKSQLPSNVQTNQRDILYIDSYPGIISGGLINPIRPLNTLAHEYQHLIHFNYNRRINSSEFTFINEGQSNFASLLSGYFPHNSLSDYLEETNVPIFRWDDENNTLPDYGRAASFTSYLWDQLGFEKAGILTQNSLSGITGINSTLDLAESIYEFKDILVNWGIANLVNDTLNTGNKEFGYSHPLLAGFKTSSFDELGVNFSNRRLNVQQGGIKYIELGISSNLRVTSSWSGSNGEARLITFNGANKNVQVLQNGVTFTSPEEFEYNEAYIMLVNTKPSQNESISSEPLVFNVSSSGSKPFTLQSDSSYSTTGNSYWQLPYFNSSNVGRFGFTNKFSAPSSTRLFALELFILNGVDGQQEPILIKGSGTMTISVHQDLNGIPGAEYASKEIDFSSLGYGWQTFYISDWELSFEAGEEFHVRYSFNVPEVDPNINGVPLRLDDGNGTQNVTNILTSPSNYQPMFSSDAGQFGVLNKVVYANPNSDDEEIIETNTERFILNQNYPNPFNPVTTIQFNVPESAEITLTIYNVLGQEVATLANSLFNPGVYSIPWNSGSASSGIYFYSLKSGDFFETKKMLLLK